MESPEGHLKFVEMLHSQGVFHQIAQERLGGVDILL
jgi:hypothetical protein